MSLVTITEASRLINKNRTTIYKYINNGKLSTTIDVDGSKKIDTSELTRVFPNIKIPQQKQQIINNNQQEVTTLKHKIELLENEIKNLNKIVDLQNKQIDTQARTILILEDKTSSTKATKVATPSKKWYHIFRKKNK